MAETDIKIKQESQETPDEQFHSLELFHNFDLAKSYADQGCYGIKIKTIEKALNVPFKFLSGDKLKDCVFKFGWVFGAFFLRLLINHQK